MCAGEPVLDGGWRNKLATPIFKERVRIFNSQCNEGGL